MLVLLYRADGFLQDFSVIFGRFNFSSFFFFLVHFNSVREGVIYTYIQPAEGKGTPVEMCLAGFTPD